MNELTTEKLIQIKTENKDWIKKIKGCTGISVGIGAESGQVCLKVYHTGDLSDESQQLLREKLSDLGSQLAIEETKPVTQQKPDCG